MGVGLRAASGAAEDAGGEHDEVEEVAAGKRQIFDLAFLDDARDAALRGFDERCGGQNGHFFSGSANVDNEVDRSRLSDLQSNLILDDGLETLERYADGILAVAERGEAIVSRVVRLGGLRHGGVEVGKRDGGAGNNRTARIGDGALDGAGELRVRPPGGEKNEKCSRAEDPGTPPGSHGQGS